MKKITALILILILLFTGTATFADDGEQMYCVSVDSFLASTPVHNGSTTAKYPGAAEAVVSAAKKSAAEVDLSSYKIRKEDISSFFKDIVDSEPLMFNVSRKIQCMLSSTGMLSKLVFDYTMTADEYKSALLLVEYTADNFMSQIKDGASDFEKALILHDRIAEAYHYDLTYKNDDIYSFITEGKGVCQAYTLLYKYLLDKSGIENAVSSSLTINHIWNLVKLNGKWYNVDVTWDDPLVSDSICDITGTVHHRYFLNSDALSESQGHENAMAKYACTDTRYDSKNYRNICSPFVRVSGKLYCFSGGICEYSPASDSVKTVYADNEKWPVWGNSLQYYTRDFSGLSLYNGTLIYNTATAVKAYSFAEKSAKAIHTPNTSNGYIYGSTLKGDTVIYSISKGGKKAVNEHSFKISDDTVNPKPDPDPSVKLPFTDVKNSHWFFDAVKYAYENGLMSGISKTVFAPNSTTSRAMLVKVLYNMEKPEGVYKTNPFKDVPEGMWYTEPIKWAYGENIVTGVSKTAFSPDAVITREQFAAILYRYAKYKGYDISAVTDVSKYNDFSKTSAYAKPALIWSIAKGFITGMNNTELSPKGNATRAQMAAIIMRYREAQKSSVDIPNKASA